MPGIFISYRRADSPDATGRIYDRLLAEFGRAQVFKDIDSIPLGRDFRTHLGEMVGDCAAVLAIVGPHWTNIRNEAGERRLDDADDFVRIELEAALARNIPVVPVLVGHATQPTSPQLPASLAPLAYRQSIEVRPDPDFHHDATRLIKALRGLLDPEAAALAVSTLAENVSAAAGAQGKSRSGQGWWIIAAIAAALSAIVMSVPAIRLLRAPPPAEMRLQIPGTDAAGALGAFALSPDGGRIVYSATGKEGAQLWLQSLSTAQAEPLPGTEGALDPFWSSDGRSIGFFVGSDLKRLDLGGTSRTLAQVVDPRGATWNADGAILVAPGSSSSIMRVAASGGAVQAVTRLGPTQVSHRWPQFLPDGKRFLFLVRGAPEESGIYLGSLNNTAPVRLVASEQSAAYLPSGWLIWGQGGSLVGQRLDTGKPALVGNQVTLAQGLDTANSRTNVSVSSSLVAFRRGSGSQRQLRWFDRSGTAGNAVGATFGWLWSFQLSPDGRRIVTSQNGINSRTSNLWLQEGPRINRITFAASDDTFPVWSPDGTRIAFISDRSGNRGIYQKALPGPASEERVFASSKLKNPTSWSADGRYVLYTDFDPQSRGDLWVVPMIPDSTPAILLKTAADEQGGVFSPDGRWVAYHSDQSGRYEVYVRRFVLPGNGRDSPTVGETQVQLSVAGGTYPAWRRDGKELFFLRPGGVLMAAPITFTSSGVESGVPTELFATQLDARGSESAIGRMYDIGPDGRFLINAPVGASSAAPPIMLIENWNPDAVERN
jgi:Tol biopolymer transport system component